MTIWMDRLDEASRPLTPLEDLSIRAANGLKSAGCVTLQDATQFTALELLEQPNFGKVSLQEVRRSLKCLGLRLRDEP